MEIYVIAHKDFSRKYIDGIRKVLLVGQIATSQAPTIIKTTAEMIIFRIKTKISVS